MRVRTDEAEHGLPDLQASAQDVKQLIDNLEINAVERDLCEYWNHPDFVELCRDEKLRKKVEAICKRIVARFRPLAAFGWDDLSQDVMLSLRKWPLPFPGARPSAAFLWRVARNRLIDAYRRLHDRACSFEELDLENQKTPPSSHDAVSKLQNNVQLHELYQKLRSAKERQLFIAYFIHQKSVTEIADERGVTRQAVSRQIQRMVIKLRQYVK
jgi:RNA polymerase sigma factor (sigma-70 family)